MKHLFGGPAFTPFQQQKIVGAAGIEGVKSAEVFLLDTRGELSALDQDRLRALLQVADAPAESSPDVMVVPRVGTISPWSSKATEILQVCGLSVVRRIERGVAIWVDGPPERVSPQVCDPMTQSIMTSIEEAEALFSRADPLPAGPRRGPRRCSRTSCPPRAALPRTR